MLVDTGHDKVTLVKCPACNTDLTEKSQTWHISNHNPEDFGLSPMRRNLSGDGLFVVPRKHYHTNTVHRDGGCDAVWRADTVLPATVASLRGDERWCRRCCDVEVDR